MQNLTGKAAFITGGASGLGLALARVFGRAGMMVSIADVRRDRIDEALELLHSEGIVSHGLTMDVTDRDAYRNAADEAEARYGPVQLLCNNAGIGIMGRLVDATYHDWDWILGVNLGGVVNGLRTFLPRMRAHRQGGHILATASLAGLCASENVGIYVGAKMGVVGIMEVLRAELGPELIGVSIICPHLMRTRIHEHAALRPKAYQNIDPAQGDGLEPAVLSDPDAQARSEAMAAAGMDPMEVAEHTLRAVLANRLYVIPFPELRGIVHERYQAILAAIPKTKPDPHRVKMEAPTLTFSPYVEAMNQVDRGV